MATTSQFDRPSIVAAAMAAFPPTPAVMRALRLGAVAALVVAATLALLWVTGAVPRSDIADMAPKAMGAVAVLVVTGVLLGLFRARVDTPDQTDKPVP